MASIVTTPVIPTVIPMISAIVVSVVVVSAVSVVSVVSFRMKIIISIFGLAFALSFLLLTWPSILRWRKRIFT